MPRILVTNDDGIDSAGLHCLARAARALGDVVVVAPDAEYSGASIALGPLHLIRPEVHEAEIPGIDEAWSVSGPPALCVYYARLGAFSHHFDLVLAGINPGANVGRSLQHSGTVGAVLAGASSGLPGVAVSQAVAGLAVEGQAMGTPEGQQWDTAATVGVTVGAALLDGAGSPEGGGAGAGAEREAVAVNVNVPNLPLGELAGWRATAVAPAPSRGGAGATLVPKAGATGSYDVEMRWGEPQDLPPESDAGAVQAGWVSVSVLVPLTTADPRLPVPGAGALTDLLGAGSGAGRGGA